MAIYEKDKTLIEADDSIIYEGRIKDIDFSKEIIPRHFLLKELGYE